jgi:hypothetical protein
MSALYELCLNWPGWSWTLSPKEICIPDYKANPCDGVEFVMFAITADLPPYVRQMIINIAAHEFERIVPTAKYEYAWKTFVRRSGSSR